MILPWLLIAILTVLLVAASSWALYLSRCIEDHQARASRYERTIEELQAWHDSPRSKGMTDAGETKLPPKHTWQRMTEDTRMTVARARVTAPYGYHTLRNCAKVTDAAGVEWFVKRVSLRLPWEN